MQNMNLKIGEIIKLKKLNYKDIDKINEGVGFVEGMTHYKQKFEIISIRLKNRGTIYKVKGEEELCEFWIENWQIASNKTKLEI